MSKGRKFNDKGSDQASNVGGHQSAKFTGSYTFVSPYLTESDRQWLEDNLDNSETMVFDLVFGISESFKFSVSFDGKSGRYLATLARTDIGHSDSGKILSVRGSTPFNAAYALAYLHNEKLSAGWGETSNSKNDKWG